MQSATFSRPNGLSSGCLVTSTRMQPFDPQQFTAQYVDDRKGTFPRDRPHKREVDALAILRDSNHTVTHSMLTFI